MEPTVIGDGARVQHFTLHKIQAETRWKHPNSKRQETFKACQSAERVMATASRDAEIAHVGQTPRGTAVEVNAYCDML
jgi:hypothetical protein